MPPRTRKTLEDWQLQDAERLRALFQARRGRMSLDEFGRRFQIGSAVVVSQYINGSRPLNTQAASAFARGLAACVEDLSPRIAVEIARTSANAPDIVPQARPGAETGQSLSDRINLVMAEQRLGADALASVLGVQGAVVRAWLDDEAARLQLHHAVKLQDAYGYSPNWLINGKGGAQLPNLEEPELDEPSLTFDIVPFPRGSFRRIPVIGMAQLGDNGHFSDIEYPVGHGDGYLNFPTDDPDAYGLRCHGDSMRPRIKHNEFVVVEPNRAVVNGDEVLVKEQDGRVMIKELAYVRDGYVHLTSVNEKFGKVKVAQDRIERIQFVAGIVKASAWRPA